MTRRSVLVAGVLLAALGLAACGKDIARPVQPGDPVTPYAGPLYLDAKDAANPTERTTGAAGRVVDCETRVVGEFRPGRYEGGETGRTPEDGLREGLDDRVSDGPETGYLLERKEGDRALFTIRVDGAVKMAVILHDGPALGAPSGWHLESWARCDPSEFPESVTSKRGRGRQGSADRRAVAPNHPAADVRLNSRASVAGGGWRMAGRTTALLAACVLVPGLTSCAARDRPPAPAPAERPCRGQPLRPGPDDLHPAG